MSLRYLNQFICHTLTKPRSVIYSVRLYSRWMHRKPAKVHLAFEPPDKVDLKKEKIINLGPESLSKGRESQTQSIENVVSEEETKSGISHKKSKELNKQREEKLKKRKFYLSQLKVFDDNNEIIFEKCKDNDGRIRSVFCTDIEQDRYRMCMYFACHIAFPNDEQYSSFETCSLVCAPLFLESEVNHNWKMPNCAILSCRNSNRNVSLDNGHVSYHHALLTNLKSKKDRIRTQQVLVEGWRLIVDGLEAKCNLKYVIFSQTEDLNNLRPFLPKTGVKFYKIPYKEIDLWSNVETSPGILGVFEIPSPGDIKRLSKPLPLDLICDNIRMPGNLGAILRAAVGAGCDKVLLTKGCVDVWDPKVVRSASGAHFRLPIKHSLDWEDIAKHLEERTSVFIADSNASIDDDIENYDTGNPHIPVVPYYGVQFSTLDHITLVIGGETEGISEESYSLTARKNGMRLNIPMAKGVDSLNTGMATAVIAFEIRRQLIQAWTKIKLDRQAHQAT